MAKKVSPVWLTGGPGHRRVAYSLPAAAYRNQRSDSPRQPAEAGRFVAARLSAGRGDVAKVERPDAWFNPGAVTGVRPALT